MEELWLAQGLEQSAAAKDRERAALGETAVGARDSEATAPRSSEVTINQLREATRRLYLDKNENMVQKLDDLFAKYKDGEAAMFDRICRKYSVSPRQYLVAGLKAFPNERPYVGPGGPRPGD